MLWLSGRVGKMKEKLKDPKFDPQPGQTNKKTIEIDTWGQFLKLFVLNLQIFVISLSICPWQAFTA